MALEFRNRGSALHVVRTTRNTETGEEERARLGAVQLGRARVSPDLVGKLSFDEKVELDARVGEMRALVTLRQKAAAHTLAWTATDAVRYLGEVTDPDEAEALSAVFAEAAATLRRGVRHAATEGRRAEADEPADC